MNLGVIVVVAVGNSAKTAGFFNSDYLSKLASASFPLIRVGAVDNTGALAAFSQEGDVYTCGVNALCADTNFVIQERDSDGTSSGEFKSCYRMKVFLIPLSFISCYSGDLD